MTSKRDLVGSHGNSRTQMGLTSLECTLIEQHCTAGLGIIYGSIYDIHFQCSSYFENNCGSDMYIINGSANF